MKCWLNDGTVPSAVGFIHLWWSYAVIKASWVCGIKETTGHHRATMSLDCELYITNNKLSCVERNMKRPIRSLNCCKNWKYIKAPNVDKWFSKC